ncbi:MAG: hypothetical protein RL248_1935 [Pseudomonadota bacterium]|jgi:hypothetical protein
MSELISSTKSSTHNYVPLSRGSERLENVINVYSMDGWETKSETIYNRGKIFKATLTKEQIVDNIKTVKIKSFDSVTNKIKSITEKYNGNTKKWIEEEFDYDSVRKTVKPINRIEATQDIGSQGSVENSKVEKFYYESISKKFVLMERIKTSQNINPNWINKTTETIDSKGNVTLQAEVVYDHENNIVNKTRLEQEFNSNGDIIYSTKSTYDANENLTGTVQVNKIFNSNNNIISSTEDTYDANGQFTGRVKVNQIFNANEVIIKKEMVEETITFYGATANETKYTYYNGRFNDKNSFTTKVEKVFAPNGELANSVKIRQQFDYYDNVILSVTEGLNSVGELRYRAGEGTGFVPTMEVFDEGLKPIKTSFDTVSNLLMSNNIFGDVNQLADSISSFPTKESTPTPADNIISSQIPERHRSIVPDRRYPI